MLIESIIEHFENDESAAALRAVLPVGSMVAEFDLTTTPEPYVILREGETLPSSIGFEFTYRVDETPVVFDVVVTGTREECFSIVSAIDNTYQTTQLPGTLGYPFFISRTPVARHGDSLDRWQCLCAYKFAEQRNYPPAE